jgi:hypothetical protein
MLIDAYFFMLHPLCHLDRNEVGCSKPEECEKICQSPGGCTNIAFVLLVLDLLPTGLVKTRIVKISAC